jgi:hypothetical protein
VSDPFEMGRVMPERKIGASASSDRMLEDLQRRYVAPGLRLMALSSDEASLVAALRADPDQQRHIVQYDAEGWGVTVRHPINERVFADDLFACPVLAFAEESLGGHPTGRYRLSTEGDDFERIES